MMQIIQAEYALVKVYVHVPAYFWNGAPPCPEVVRGGE